MNVNGTEYQIMWKEIAIILLIVFVLRYVAYIYAKKVYINLYNQFCSNKWDGIERKLERHRKFCRIFSGGYNKNERLIYNEICVMLASLALIKNDETAFVAHLGEIKKSNEFAKKHFLLALYYRAKQKDKAADISYNDFLKCADKNGDMITVLEYLFRQETHFDSASVKAFKNPAVIKLFKENGLGTKNTGDGSPVS